MSEDEQIKISEDGEYTTYRGYRLPGPKIFKPENIVAGINYRPLDGDIVLCGYPKTGNTWMTYIVWMILHRGESYPELDEISHVLVPFVERTGIETVKALKPPRFYKNHFHYGLMEINPKTKYLYTYRRPEDVVVSFYHFRKTPRSGDYFNEFFEKFVDGKSPYGDYFEHILEYYAHKDEDHIMMVSYEALKANPREEILRIAKFLGEDHYGFLKENDSLVDEILEKTSFDYMKSKLKLTIETPDGVKRDLQFFRKGVVGDGRQTLSDEQLKKLKAVMRRKLEGSRLLKDWES